MCRVWHLDRPTVMVDGHHREIARVGVSDRTLLDILGLYANADLQSSVKISQAIERESIFRASGYLRLQDFGA